MIKKTILVLMILVLFSAASFSADWELDPAHSSISFSVRHMVVSKTKGHFNDFTGIAAFDAKDFSNGEVTFNVKMSSIDTDNQKRDKHLKSADFFDVEKYSEMKFKSKKISNIENRNFRLIGDLTIKDVTKEVTFLCEYYGEVNDPMGNTRTGFSAKSKINRQDFNITWSKVMETGGLIVGDEVNIELEVEWIKSKTENDSLN